MKIKFIYVFTLLLFTWFISQSHLTGVGTNIGADSTGSPLSTTSCVSCHGNVSSPIGSTLGIRVLNSSGGAIASYVPGAVYTLEMRLINESGLAYGVQATIFDGYDAQVGVFNPAVGNNTDIVSINGRDYVENGSNPNLPPYNYTIEWTAPPAGTGGVRVYAAAAIAALPYGLGGDYTMPPVTLFLVEFQPTSIDYPNTRYCSADSIATVDVTGMTGGIFTSSPAGLIINLSTGEVDLINSTPGQTYTITYQIAGTTSSDVIDVETSFYAEFGFTDTTYCANSGVNPILSIVGTSPGVYSSSPNGLAFISTSTGEVDLINSIAGIYTVSYRSYGICPGKDTATVRISVCSDLDLVEDEFSSRVYPNPSNGQFVIEPSMNLDKVVVTNLLGVKVYEKKLFNKREKRLHLDLSFLAKGIYLVQLEQKNKREKPMKIEIF